jgi:hypothetical protein
MLKLVFDIEPWDQIKSFRITTLYASIELKEEEDFVRYEFAEFGRLEGVECKFRLRKRPNYKEYLRDFIQFDVDAVNLKNLTGVVSYFQEVHQHVAHLFRRGMVADLKFKWRDKDMHVSFGLRAARSGEGAEILSGLTAEYGSEYVMLHHSKKAENAEDELERHVKEAVGLYLLFKEYALQEEELSKT